MTNNQIPKHDSAVDFSDLLEYDEFEAYDAFQMPSSPDDAVSDNVPLSVELAQSVEHASRQSDSETFVKAPELFLRFDGIGKSQPESLAETPIRDFVELQYENEFDEYEDNDELHHPECSTSFRTIENDNEQLLLEGMSVTIYQTTTESSFLVFFSINLTSQIGDQSSNTNPLSRLPFYAFNHDVSMSLLFVCFLMSKHINRTINRNKYRG